MNLDKRIRIRNLDVLNPPKNKSRLRWKEYQILSLLVSRSPALVTRSEIIENIWKGTYCADSTINQTIKSIRQKIGDSEHTLIRTIPRLGYKVENSAFFHFLTDDENDISEPILTPIIDCGGDIQAEYSENSIKNYNEKYNEMMIIPQAEPQVATLTATGGINGAAKKKWRFNGFFSMSRRRVMTYLTVMASLLVISHFFFVLSNQVPLPGAPDIQSNTRVMLTLTLNEPLSASPQALLCVYQGDDVSQATIECIDSKYLQPVKYHPDGTLNFILPTQKLEYQVVFDVVS